MCSEDVKKEKPEEGEKDKGRIKNPLVYIPPGAKLNVGNEALAAPKSRYDKRRVVYNRNALKKAIRRDPDGQH